MISAVATEMSRHRGSHDWVSVGWSEKIPIVHVSDGWSEKIPIVHVSLRGDKARGNGACFARYSLAFDLFSWYASAFWRWSLQSSAVSSIHTYPIAGALGSLRSSISGSSPSINTSPASRQGQKMSIDGRSMFPMTCVMLTSGQRG
jgi:hypothetical protein